VPYEIDCAQADLKTLLESLLTGQFNNPLRVVAFNTAEGWSRDASEDVAWELRKRVAKAGKPLAATTRGFVEYHVGQGEMPRAEAGLL
jgi:hypothetical protein